MLRESSVPYSSLPQEEGEQTYVSTRASGEPQTHNKQRLLTTIVVLLLICGVPLMIIAPIALSRGSGRSGTFVNFPHIEGQSEDNTLKNNRSSLVTAATPIPHIAISIPVLKASTLKPPTTAPATTTTSTTTTTTTTTTSTTTPPTTTTTTTTTTTPAPAPATTFPIVVIPPVSVVKPVVEVPVGEPGKNQSGVTETTQMPESQEGHEEGSGSGSPDSEENGGISYTPTQNISSIMNNFMSEHEWWTVVGLAVAAALALAAVITAIAWIIKNRLASRRRKTNLQKVITDLQSRDKVVLLNSEDSEDDA